MFVHLKISLEVWSYKLLKENMQENTHAIDEANDIL